jgi:hypothetical protein
MKTIRTTMMAIRATPPVAPPTAAGTDDEKKIMLTFSQIFFIGS